MEWATPDPALRRHTRSTLDGAHVRACFVLRASWRGQWRAGSRKVCFLLDTIVLEPPKVGLLLNAKPTK
eukprot:1501841-Pyramimonas_sp.AAC.1